MSFNSSDSVDEAIDIDPAANIAFQHGILRDGIDFVLSLEDAMLSMYEFESEEVAAVQATMSRLCSLVNNSKSAHKLTIEDLLGLGLEDYSHLVYPIAAEVLQLRSSSPMALSVSEDLVDRPAFPEPLQNSGSSIRDCEYPDDFEDDDIPPAEERHRDTGNQQRGRQYESDEERYHSDTDTVDVHSNYAPKAMRVQQLKQKTQLKNKHDHKSLQQHSEEKISLRNPRGISSNNRQAKGSPCVEEEEIRQKQYAVEEEEEEELLFIRSGNEDRNQKVVDRGAVTLDSKQTKFHNSNSNSNADVLRPKTTPPQSLRKDPRDESAGDFRRPTAADLPPIKYSEGGDDRIASIRVTPDGKSNISGSQPAVQSTGMSLAVSRSSKGHHRRATWIAAKRWSKGDKIGQGSFGEVFQGMDDKGCFFAVKVLNMQGKQSEVNNLAEEIEIMLDLQHENIVRYIGTWVDEAASTVNIFQEWVSGGSVAHLLKKFGPFRIDVVKNYTRQIVTGLKYLHEKGFVHRDIKGGNVLVENTGIVKLADFGASKKLDLDGTQATQNIKGTPYFMAPEVLSDCRYGRKGDIWAVGCTVIQMLTGEPPWKEQNVKTLIQLHILLSGWKKGPPPFTREIPEDCRRCLELCFEKDETKRPLALALLEHPFLHLDLLEDSMNFNNANDNANGDMADDLDASDGMTGLREQLERVVSNQSHSGPISKILPKISKGNPSQNSNYTDDTFTAIERQIEVGDRKNDNKATPAKNPFAKGAVASYKSPVVDAVRYRDHYSTGNPSDESSSNSPVVPVIDTSYRHRQYPIAHQSGLDYNRDSDMSSQGNNPYSRAAVAAPNQQHIKVVSTRGGQNKSGISQSSTRDSEVNTPFDGAGDSDDETSNDIALFRRRQQSAQRSATAPNSSGSSGSSSNSNPYARRPASSAQIISDTTGDKNRYLEPVQSTDTRLRQQQRGSRQPVNRNEATLPVDGFQCLKCSKFSSQKDAYFDPSACCHCGTRRGASGVRLI